MLALLLRSMRQYKGASGEKSRGSKVAVGEGYVMLKRDRLPSLVHNTTSASNVRERIVTFSGLSPLRM
jgi:hypothetical protein